MFVFSLEKEHINMSGMARTLMSKGATLKKMDRTMHCDLWLLEHRAESLLRERVEGATIACLPDETHFLTVMQAPEKIDDIKHSDIVLASSRTVQGDVIAVHGFLSDMKMRYACQIEAAGFIQPNGQACAQESRAMASCDFV